MSGQKCAQIMSYVLFYPWFSCFLIQPLSSMSSNPSSSLPSNSSVAISSKSVDFSNQLLSKLSCQSITCCDLQSQPQQSWPPQRRLPQLKADRQAWLAFRSSTQRQMFLQWGVQGHLNKRLSSRRSSWAPYAVSSKLSIRIKTQRSQSWSSGLSLTQAIWTGHGPALQRFVKSFHQLAGTVQQFISTEKKRYYIMLSEPEFVSVRTFQRVRSPRINDDESERAGLSQHHALQLSFRRSQSLDLPQGGSWLHSQLQRGSRPQKALHPQWSAQGSYWGTTLHGQS